MGGDPDDERAALLAAVEEHEDELRRSLLKIGPPNPALDSGLTMQQLRVLLLIAADGPMAHGDLAHALGVGVATVTGLVDRLVARGMVERTEDPDDRRVRRAGLSPAGLSFVDRMAVAGQEGRRALLQRLDVDALRALEHGMRALRAALEQGCGDP